MIEVCNKIFNCSLTKFENPDFVDESHQLGVVTVDLRGKDFDYIVSAYREQSQKVLSYRQIDTINLVMLVDIDVLDSFLIGEVVDKINEIDLHHNFDKIVFCAVCMTSAYRVLTYDSWKAKYELSDMVYLD